VKEVEVKIYDIDEKALREQLKISGATLIKDVVLRTYYYDNEYTKAKHVQARLRYEGKRTVLTVKGPRRIVRNLKVQDEYELEVDGPKADLMLRTLGFTLASVIEMKRTYYSLRGCSVEICRLPRAKTFIEIEGRDKSIREVARMLGYTEKDFDNTPVRKKLGVPKSLKRWVFS
jgi:predicted adenylyl cyclase CyaB